MFETVPLSLHHFFTLEISFLQRIKVIFFFKRKEKEKEKVKERNQVSLVFAFHPRDFQRSVEIETKRNKKNQLFSSTHLSLKSHYLFAQQKTKNGFFSNFKKSLLGAFTFS
jgi:hypothetical protein